ncbi:MAG: molybdenum cofactor guanylyltransferase [Chromatiales bacterium]|nr:molybdenum cofactor guanylyltransferase [Gammaproteobacteria bacterium]
MIDNVSIAGVILAGGQASRMGGEDKGLTPLNGRLLIEYVIEAVKPQTDHLLISANRNFDRYGNFGFAVIPDPIDGFPGPLAGMLSALQHTTADLLLTVPCDGPWVPTNLLERLFTTLANENADVCCVHDGERMHPVFSLIRRELTTELTAYIDAGGRAVHRWFKQQRLALADFSSDPELFTNINTPGELERIEKLMQEQARK